MAQTLIQVKDLKKYYNGGDVKALDGVTVDVYCRITIHLGQEKKKV